MLMLASLRSDWWSTCPELVDDFIGIRSDAARQGAAGPLFGLCLIRVPGICFDTLLETARCYTD